MFIYYYFSSKGSSPTPVNYGQGNRVSNDKHAPRPSCAEGGNVGEFSENACC